MRKVIVSTMITIDAVMENPQNWTFDYMKDDLAAYANDQLFASDALLMGRVTYEAFAESWSARAGADAFTDRINGLPKYVASRTLKEPLAWTANLLKDIPAEVAALKQQAGLNILQYGIGELTQTLMQHGLVDEIRLLVFPVVVGNGQRILEKIAQTPMKLLEAKPFSTGVVALHYQPSPGA